MEKVKFEQFQQVKKEALKAFADDTTLNVPFVDAARTDSLNLALIGDAYYALTLRRCLTATGIPNARVLHSLAAEFVSAKVQSVVYEALKEDFTEEETAVCRRARNAKMQVPKSATVGELIGYLILSEQDERLQQIMNCIVSYTRKYSRDSHKE